MRVGNDFFLYFVVNGCECKNIEECKIASMKLLICFTRFIDIHLNTACYRSSEQERNE